VSRILLCWELGTDYQHLLSLQSIARFYQGKGYDVWVAARVMFLSLSVCLQMLK